MTLLDLMPTVRRSSREDDLPVAIIDAGPIGLAAAANLVERGIDFVIYESGDSIASSMNAWRHIRLISPWEHLVDPAAKRLLEPTGWQEPQAGVAPYAAAMIDDYLTPLAALVQMASRIRLGVTVESVSREGMDRTRSTGRAASPFVLRVHEGTDVSEVVARAVIDCSGTYENPNSLSSNGLVPLDTRMSPTRSVMPCLTSWAPNAHSSPASSRWSSVPATPPRTLSSISPSSHGKNRGQPSCGLSVTAPRCGSPARTMTNSPLARRWTSASNG